MWQVLYSDENVPMIIMDFDTMQFKIIQDFDNSKKRKRNHDEDGCHDDDWSPKAQYLKINEDQNNEKSDSISYNDYTKDDDTEDDDVIEQDIVCSTLSSSEKKCDHYIKNRILASHQNDIEAAREYMRIKKLNKKRGALPKWVKRFESII